MFEKLDAVQLTLFVTLFQRFQPFGKLAEAGVVDVLPQALRYLDFNLFGLFSGIGRTQQRFDQIGVEHDVVEIIAHGFDMDILVNQINRLGPQGVPEQRALTGGRLHRDIHL